MGDDQRRRRGSSESPSGKIKSKSSYDHINSFANENNFLQIVEKQFSQLMIYCKYSPKIEN